MPREVDRGEGVAYEVVLDRVVLGEVPVAAYQSQHLVADVLRRGNPLGLLLGELRVLDHRGRDDAVAVAHQHGALLAGTEQGAAQLLPHVHPRQRVDQVRLLFGIVGIAEQLAAVGQGAQIQVELRQHRLHLGVDAERGEKRILGGRELLLPIGLRLRRAFGLHEIGRRRIARRGIARDRPLVPQIILGRCVGVIQRLVARLDPEAIAGTILIVGIVNYHAFQVAEHRNPIDDTKMNRAYPGDEEGTSSERIAAATFDAAKRADYVLDLHQGSTSRMLNEARVRCGRHHRRHADCLELAKAFGTGYVLDQKGPDGQLARAAPDEGIPTIDPELGGCVGWDEESIQYGVEGVFNVLRYYGFLDGDVNPAPQTRATGFDRYGSPSGGLVRFRKELGDRVEVGDLLFEVTTPFGQLKAEVTADDRGVFWRSRRLPQVATGEYVCSVGTDVDEF